MRGRVLVVFAALIACASVQARAQTVDTPSDEATFVEALEPAQERALDDWLSDVEKWQKYAAKYDNRPARDLFGRITQRRQPPEAPDWLGAWCAAARRTDMTLLAEQTTLACRLLEDPRASGDALSARVQAARMAAEKPDKYSSFLRRIHLDGLWVTTSSGPRAYGIVGSHITLVDVGPVQVFGPPGVLLVSLPDAGGGRRVTLGYTWGLSVRIGDVSLGAPRNMTLFLTMSKVWIGGEASAAQPAAGGFQVIGLSLAARKR
jgi:hypothetical protein